MKHRKITPAFVDLNPDSIQEQEDDRRAELATVPQHITVDQAVTLINSLVFMPEWKFEAEPWTKRFQDAVKIHVIYAARNSNRDQAPAYSEWIEGGARADFAIQVTDTFTPEDVVRKLIDQVIMPIMSHEVREFLRFPGTLVAPFHPHNHDTMDAWGEPRADLGFGVV